MPIFLIDFFARGLYNVPMSHEHFEEHSCSCGCEEGQREKHSFFTARFFVSLAGFAAFLAAHIPDKLFGVDLWYVYVAAYLLLGWDVILSCFKELFRGKFFTENFLMTLASAAALLLSNYTEAVAVMLFYKIGQFFLSLAVRNSRAAIAEKTSPGEKTPKSVMEDFIAKFAKIYTPVILILAVVLSVALPLLHQKSFTETLPAILPFLVLACPCGIVISVPLACFAGTGANKGTAAIKRVSIQNIVFILFVKAVVLITGLITPLPLALAIFGDVGVTLLAILNSMRLLLKRKPD